MCPESPPPPASSARSVRGPRAPEGPPAGAGAGPGRGLYGASVGAVCVCMSVRACVYVHARGGRGDAALNDRDRAGDSQRGSQGALHPLRQSPHPTCPGSACWRRGMVQRAPVWAASRRGSGKRALLSVRATTGGCKLSISPCARRAGLVSHVGWVCGHLPIRLWCPPTLVLASLPNLYPAPSFSSSSHRDRKG